MIPDDSIRKLYVDCKENLDIKTDDFIVAIGKLKSNSVYHIIESRMTKSNYGFRFHIRVMKSDLLTALKRNSNQQLIPMFWYNRNKKTN